MTIRHNGDRPLRMDMRNNRLVRTGDRGLHPVNGPAVVLRGGRLVRRMAPPVAVENVEAAPYGLAGTSAKVGGLTTVFIVLAVISLLIPAAQRFGPFRLTPYLVLLLVGMLPMIGIWLSGRRTKVILPDLLMLGYCLWAATALILSAGTERAMEPVGILILQSFGAYLAGRLLVRDPASMRLLVRVTTIALIAMLPAVAIEALTGQKIMLRLGALFGQPLPSVDTGVRMGLHRAQGAFEHPILMGVFCASILSLTFYAFPAPRHRIIRWLGLPAVLISGIFSMSTGALLTLNIQFGLMIWSRLFRTVRKRWRILTVLLTTAYIAIDLASTKSPFHVFVNYATFSAKSSYNRILIWQYGSAEALRHPLFGIGLNQWTRPRYMSDSMDNFWLLQAVRYGIPAFVLLLSAICVILFRMGKIDYGNNQDLTLMRRGVTFALIATMVAIISVHLWNASYVWLIFLVGSSAWLANSKWATPNATGTPA